MQIGTKMEGEKNESVRNVKTSFYQKDQLLYFVLTTVLQNNDRKEVQKQNMVQGQDITLDVDATLVNRRMLNSGESGIIELKGSTFTTHLYTKALALKLRAFVVRLELSTRQPKITLV